jgi:phage gp29-like protein
MPTFAERIAGMMPERFKEALLSLVPTKRVTIYSERYAPRVGIETIDADRIHSIIEGAEGGDTRDLFALYREVLLTDSHLQGEFAKRKLAVLGDVISVHPKDKKKQEDVAAADAVRAVVESDDRFESQVGPFTVVVNDFLSACIHLLDSTLWPVTILEKVYKPSVIPGVRYDIAELVPVPEQLLDWVLGRTRIRETDPNTGSIMGGFNEIDPNRYIVHRSHVLTTPDFRGGPMRSLLMWWMLSSFSRDWWARFLDKYGSPFLVGKYPQGDDASRRILERAFQWAVKIGGLVVSTQTQVEMQQAMAASSGEAFEKFFTIAQREKSKLIIGQAASEQRSSGLGSGISKQQENVRDDIRQWDAKRLASTLRSQLFRQYLDINGFKGAVPLVVWGAESIEATKTTADILASLASADIEPTDDGIETLGERIGIPLQRAVVDAPPIPPPVPGFRKGGGSAKSAFTASGRLAHAAIEANDQISAEASPNLAQAFRGSLAPVRRIIIESQSAHECETRLREFYADWPASKIQTIIDQALTAQAANATHSNRFDHSHSKAK